VGYGCTEDGGNWKSIGQSVASQSDCANLCAGELSTGCCFYGASSCYFKEGSSAQSSDTPSHRATVCTLKTTKPPSSTPSTAPTQDPTPEPTFDPTAEPTPHPTPAPSRILFLEFNICHLKKK
jgi:hypothetical protein